MTSKQYLSQAFHIDQRINSKMEQIESLRSMMTKTGVTMSDMPGNPNKDRSRLEETFVKIMTMEDSVNKDLNRLIDLRNEIMTAIKGVDDLQCQMVLELRYLCFHTWEDIAIDLNCSVRNVHLLHGRALGMIKVPG